MGRPRGTRRVVSRTRRCVGRFRGGGQRELVSLLILSGCFGTAKRDKRVWWLRAVGSVAVVRVTYGVSSGFAVRYTMALASLFTGGHGSRFYIRVVTDALPRTSRGTLSDVTRSCKGGVYFCFPRGSLLGGFSVGGDKGEVSVTACCHYLLSQVLPMGVSGVLCVSYSVIILGSVDRF